MADVKFTEDDFMEFLSIEVNGKKYICLDDVIAYLRHAQEQLKDHPEHQELMHFLIKSFVWCKNNKP